MDRRRFLAMLGTAPVAFTLPAAATTTATAAAIPWTWRDLKLQCAWRASDLGYRFESFPYPVTKRVFHYLCRNLGTCPRCGFYECGTTLVSCRRRLVHGFNR